MISFTSTVNITFINTSYGNWPWNSHSAHYVCVTKPNPNTADFPRIWVKFPYSYSIVLKIRKEFVQDLI